MKIDLHMHTTISDGTDSPEEILAHVKEAGIEVFSVTDHDSIDCASVMPGLLKKGDPAFITGVEFSCKDEDGKCHMLGYGYDPESESIRRVVEMGHNFRMDTARRRVQFLKDTFDITFPEEEIEQFFALDNPGKPHLARLMVKCGFAKNKENAIEDFINKMPNRNNYVRPQEAIEGILGAGGIPVLAHPFFGSGSQRIPFEDLRARVVRLMGFGLNGLEAFYSGFDREQEMRALELSEELDLYVTAGSDYHGNNKTVRLGETGALVPSEEVPGLRRFLSDVRRIG